MNMLPAVLPKVRVWDTQLVDAEPAYYYQPRLGIQMRELIPLECGRAVLLVNGTALLQREWHRPVPMGDVISWKISPRGGTSSRSSLTIIAIIAIAYFSAGMATGVGIGGATGTAAV